jgi:hypothetical protein
MATVFWLSGRASIGVERRLPVPKGPAGNLFHVATFAAIGYALGRALDKGGAAAGLRTAAGRTALLVAAAFGVSDELHQFFTPGRTCSLYDAFLDGAGAGVALLAPGPGGSGRPASWRPSLALAAVAAAVAVATGIWRTPGDDLLARALDALGFSV